MVLSVCEYWHGRGSCTAECPWGSVNFYSSSLLNRESPESRVKRYGKRILKCFQTKSNDQHFTQRVFVNVIFVLYYSDFFYYIYIYIYIYVCMYVCVCVCVCVYIWRQNHLGIACLMKKNRQGSMYGFFF